jgi:type I restriction enzyme S subunit
MTDSIIGIIKPAVRRHFPGSSFRTRTMQSYLMRVCKDFVDLGLADPKFLKEITTGESAKFWAGVSEALVANLLRDQDFGQRKKIGAGPDFLIMDGSRKIWIEVVCPEPIGLSEDWLTMNHLRSGRVEMIDFPHNEILLRWTSAIKAKADKLTAREGAGQFGYRHLGIVGPDDAYVIAVNGCLLRNGPFPQIRGVSGHPFAAEAVFPFGARYIKYRLDTFETIGYGHQHRPHVLNKNAAMIPTYMFQDPRYNGISAIWAMDLKGETIVGKHEPIHVIHNPQATNPIRCGFLEADSEYVAHQEGDQFVLREFAMQERKLCPFHEKTDPRPQIVTKAKVPRKYRKASKYWKFY